MLEAVVAVAARAVAASIVLGGGLALLALAATRVLALRAATRHALWMTVLVATAVMPVAGIVVSLARATAPPSHASAAPTASTSVATTTARASTADRSGYGARVPYRRSAQAFGTLRNAAGPDIVPAPALARRFAGWTPRVSRALALALTAVWAAGALLGLLNLAASVVRVRGLRRRSSPLDAALADELPWLTETGPGREIYVRLSYETETPVAIGFRRPVVLIPTELASADGLTAIEPLVLHEHAHLRRYDDWTNLLQRTIERVLWCNPVVWLVGRRIALEREIASDDAVVEKTGAAKAYAASLWRLAREMRMPEHTAVAPGALLTRKQISVRIEQLLDANRARLHGSPAAALGIVMAAAAAVLLVATSAPALELPALPLPPAPPVVAAAAHRVRVRALPTQAPRVRAVAPTAAIPLHGSVRVSVTPPRVSVTPPHVSVAPPRTSVSVIPAESAVPAEPAEPRDVRVLARVLVERELPRAAASSLPQTGARARHDGTKLSRELVASCTACSLRGSDGRGADLHGLSLSADDFRGADLRGVNLNGARLEGVSFAGANLSAADLRGAELTGVELRDAKLDGALLDGARFVGVSLRTVSLRGTALRGVLADCTGCDLSHLDLRGQDLHGIALTGTDLSHTDLRDANLAGVRFSAVDLSHANLAGADLTGARFAACDTTGADLRGARTAGMRVLESESE